MKNLAVAPRSGPSGPEPHVRVLVADGDPWMRSSIASCARDAAGATAVLEAADGAEAIQLGLQERPQIALLDINTPRLGGIEVATTLRELQPRMRLALQTADPGAHRDVARAHRLPLFDKLELGRILSWLAVQAQSCVDAHRREESRRKRSLACSACGYGICSSTPPERCPMCQALDGWIHARPALTLLSVDRGASVSARRPR